VTAPAMSAKIALVERRPRHGWVIECAVRGLWLISGADGRWPSTVACIDSDHNDCRGGELIAGATLGAAANLFGARGGGRCIAPSLTGRCGIGH